MGAGKKPLAHGSRVFIPLHDANTLKHIRLQYVTLALIIANVVIFFVTETLPERAALAAGYGLGYVPAVVFDTLNLEPDLVLVPEDLTYLTYAFLHGDILHLGGNMLFLWVFGDNVEDALGHVRYLVFYLLCAAAGALMHGLADPASEVPLIGASGAIAGIVAAYMMLHPKVKIWVLAFGRLPLRLPAWLVLGLWIGFQVVMFLAMPEDQVSWAAHLGGILAGALLVGLLKRRAVPLFDRAIVTPRAVETVRAVPDAPQQPTRNTTPWGRAGDRHHN